MKAEWIGAIAAVASAITTIVLARLTGDYVRLTKQLAASAIAARQPSVFVDFELDPTAEVVLIVGNSGLTSARDVKFDVVDNTPWQATAVFPKPGDVPAFKYGIALLAPGRSIRFRVGHLDWKAAVAERRWLNITARFRGDTDEVLSTENNIEFGRYSGMSADSFDNPQARLADAVEQFVSTSQMQVHLQDVQREAKQRCQHCAELILQGATKCRFCLEWLDDMPRPGHASTGEGAGS